MLMGMNTLLLLLPVIFIYGVENKFRMQTSSSFVYLVYPTVAKFIVADWGIKLTPA
jgi:hypothetical protein